MASVHGTPQVFEVDDSVAVRVAARNSERKGMYLLNDTGQDLFVLFDDAVSPDPVSDTYRSFVIGHLQTYEAFGDQLYTGPIYVIADTLGDGRVTMTELDG